MLLSCYYLLTINDLYNDIYMPYVHLWENETIACSAYATLEKTDLTTDDNWNGL